MPSPDFFQEDFFAPLDADFVHPEAPTLKQLQEQQAPAAPAGRRAPARVLFDVQNDLWELVLALEHAHVLEGDDKKDFERELERVYRQLQRYLRDRTQHA